MPTQATNTTTGNWRARYASEFYDAQGRQWRVEFIDSDTTAHAEFGLSSTDDPYDVELAADGFVLQWDGPTDHVGAALVPSSCEITLAISTSAMEPLVSRIKAADDARFGLAVYYDDGGTHWKPWWVGTLNHEAIEYETKDRPYLVTLVASCGLNRLRNVEFKDSNGDAYLDKLSLAEAVAICLNKIPTANFWLGSESQLHEVVDLYNEDHFAASNQTWATSAGDAFPNSVLERTVVHGTAFAERNDGKEDEFGRRIFYPLNFNSCFDVLENVVTAFGARFMLCRFAWWFFPPNALNWSHTLRVQKWTRTIVASETLQTQLVSTLNDDTSTHEDINFEVDIETNHALGDGWSNSYLLPIKRATVTHKNAGQRSVFGVPRNMYLDYPSINSDSTKGFTNPNIVVSEGETLNLRGLYLSGDLIKEFGNITNAFNDYGTDRIGARIVVRFKIKVGSHYYGSEYSVDTPTTDIDMPLGFQGDFTDPELDFKRLLVETPSWSTTEKFFDVIIPWTHSTPPAEVENSQGWTRVGGLHIRSTGNAEFEYRIDQTQQDDVAHEFNFMTLPLPDDSSSYTGVTVNIDRIVVTCDGNVRQTFPELENIFHSVAVVDYDYEGNDLGSNTQSAPEDRLENFVVGIGANSDDADFDVFVEQSSNTEFMDLGETVLGDNTVGGVAQSDGALSVITHGVTYTADVLTTGGWESITDAIDGNDSPDELLIAMSREHLFMRGSVMAVQRGQIVPKHTTTANTSAPLDLLTVMKHNCSTQSDLAEYLVPMRLTYEAGESVFDVDAFVRSRERLSFESDKEVNTKGPTGSSTGGNPTVAPVAGQGSASTDTTVDFVNGLISTNADDISNIQSKTDFITITQAVNLDTVESQVGQNTFNISTNATNISSNSTAISNNTASITDIAQVLKSDTGGGGQGVYTDSSKATTASYMGLSSTSAKLQAGGGNTSIDLNETSPGRIEMNVQVGSSGAETSATAIDIEGTTSSQLPNITFNGNISGVELNDIDDVNAGSPSDGQALAWNQGTQKWTAQTITSTGGGDVVDDTSPQLGGDLDLNSNNITGTGNINTTGTLTTSGLASLPGIALGSTGILGTGQITTTANMSCNALSATTISTTGNASIGGDMVASNVQFSGSGTNTIGPSGTGGTQDDLEVRSNGNVTVVLDYDSDESAQAFIVKNQAGTVIFQVDEDGVTSGLLTTATPSISGLASSVQQGASVTCTVGTVVAGRVFTGEVYNSSGTLQSTGVSIDSAGNVSFTAPSTVATGYELRVYASDAGKLRSLTTTATFEVTASRTFTHWRVRSVDSSGNNSSNKCAWVDLNFYTAASGSGTVYPTTNATSNTSISGVTISAGQRYSSSYAEWKAFDSGTGQNAGSMWWTLGGNATNNWIQVEFSSAQTFASLTLQVYDGFNDATHLQIEGSNTGTFSGEQVVFGLSAITEGGGAGITTANF